MSRGFLKNIVTFLSFTAGKPRKLHVFFRVDKPDVFYYNKKKILKIVVFQEILRQKIVVSFPFAGKIVFLIGGIR